MADIYKLQYNGMTLAYPGWNGYVSFEYEPIEYVRFGAVANATATLGITATYNGQTTSWNNAGSTAYKDIPIGSDVVITASTPEYFRCGCGAPVGLDNFASANWSRGFSAHGTVTASGYATTTNTQKNTFTARGNLQWTNNFNGSYQGVADAYPSLQITGWTGTVASSTMTGGEGTNYGATGTSKANNMKAAYHAWKSFTNWKSTSLKAPVNCSAWKLSAHMNITGHRNVTSVGIFCGASERAVTAQACINGTGTGRSSVSTNSWFPTSQSNKTTAYDLTATAAKYGTATNLGSYGVHFTAYNYGTVGNGSGSCGSWAYHRVIGCNGTWLASGIMP